MYNNSYEDYMRNSLGYNVNLMTNNFNDEMYESENAFTYNQLNIDNMYPEIYRIIYPMVCKACMNINENITEDLVNRITNEIYMNVEEMQITQENRQTSANSTNSINKSTKNDMIGNKPNNADNNLLRQENRVNNFMLRDLIRILILRELFGRPLRPPMRPPFGWGMHGPGPRFPYVF